MDKLPSGDPKTDKPKWSFGEQLSAAERGSLEDLVSKHADAFAYSMKDLGKHNRYKMTIDLVDDVPVFKPKHRLSPYEWELVEQRCQELATAGLIEPSDSTFAAPTVMPAKKDAEGQYTERRMCGDYRALNLKTVQDRHPMPLPEEIFDLMGGRRFYSILDLRQGFNQIEIEPKDKHKTTFWGSKGRWQWKVMPFGLKNAPAVFQKVMDSVLGDITFAKCYIDDVIVASNTIDQHVEHLSWLFHALKSVGLKCHPAKCLFGSAAVPYLGHMISAHGVSPQQAKVSAILQIPVPKDVSQLRSFLGLANYYRRFIPKFGAVAKPLNELLQKGSVYAWGESQEAAFAILKAALTTNPVLKTPDFTLPFCLQTDWGKAGIGAVLSQVSGDGQEYVVAYASRSNNRAESNYSSYEGECLAAVWAVQHFRHYLYGKEFKLSTDHQPLAWLMTSDKLSGKLARWALILQEYTFVIEHRPGTSNLNADGLSRNPLPSTADNGARQDFDATDPAYPVWGAAVFLNLCLVPACPVQQATLPPRRVPVDVWQDTSLLTYLQTGSHATGATPQERDRVQKRAKHYIWSHGAIVRVFPAGTFKVVPQVANRFALVARVHQEMGHFGIRRTVSLLVPEYWWAGLYEDVVDVVSKCEVCARVRASFSARTPVLHPLPIRGMFYRWSCDLAGPLPTTSRKNKYIMVMIEGFSKWIEVCALPQKSARFTCAAFKECVLSRYGAPAEVLTDQGTEFRGEFQALLDEGLIDHRRTSRDHPQADGLAERMVQTVKIALTKFCLEHNKLHWDDALPYIALGYRTSKQEALSKYSPYFLLYGREPLLGRSIQSAYTQPVDLDDPVVWLQEITRRAKLLHREMPMAMENLKIAQHRDTLRYSTIRGGSYRPKQRKFEVGDYVYLRRQAQDSIDAATSPRILRVTAVRSNGILELQGADQRRATEHCKNCAPCYLPDLDGSMDPMRAPIRDTTSCELCKRADGEDTMLLCDACNLGHHMECLNPPLTEIPPGSWFCPSCQRARRTPSA